MSYEGNIQWFPGHMTKTRRMIEADIKQVDAVVEIVDARIPESSRNPSINELVGSKPRIILLNKCDYADDRATEKWKRYYQKQGYAVLCCDCRSGKGIKSFVPLLKKINTSGSGSSSNNAAANISPAAPIPQSKYNVFIMAVTPF